MAFLGDMLRMRKEPSVDRKSTVKSTGGKAGSGGVGPAPKPRTCTCAAYAWPHRPRGGLCRWPEPPKGTCSTRAGTNRQGAARVRRPQRYLFRRFGLNPIRDREEFARLRPILESYGVLTLAEARKVYAALRRQGRAPSGRVYGEDNWSWLPRDAQGRWTTS